MEELWNFAKSIAQSDGRKNDWVYIVDIYKSTGGKDMKMEVTSNRGKFEVLGEASPSSILVSDKDGEVQTIEKSEFKRLKKRFYSRSESEREIQKSVTVEGKKHEITLYIDSSK